MNFLEKDLEQIIWETDGKVLADRGLFNIPRNRKRQLRVGNYGILDMLSVERCTDPHGEKYLEITVYEFKKETIDTNTFLQAIRYCKGIQNYLNKRGFVNFNLNIVLVGKRININNDLIYITDLIGASDFCNNGFLNGINFYTYDYRFDGIWFTDHYRYALTNEGF